MSQVEVDGGEGCVGGKGDDDDDDFRFHGWID